MIHNVYSCSFSSSNSQTLHIASKSTITHKLKLHRPIEPRDNKMPPDLDGIENFGAYTAKAIEDTPGANDFPDSGECCCNVT